jgi:hypothetical protein
MTRAFIAELLHLCRPKKEKSQGGNQKNISKNTTHTHSHVIRTALQFLMCNVLNY